MLAGADKDSPSCHRDAVAASKEARDVAPAVHRSGQETQEGEVLDTLDARAARAGPQDQGMLRREAQNLALQLENAAVLRFEVSGVAVSTKGEGVSR